MIRLIVAILTFALAPFASAQIPRTPDGKPDLQGVWFAGWLTPLERVPGSSGVVVDAAEAQRVAEAIPRRAHEAAPLNMGPEWTSLAVVRGQHRAAMIVDPPDGMLPYRPESIPNRAAPTGADDPEQRGLPERCIAGASRGPMLIAPAGMLRRIVQTPGNLVIHTESLSDLRVVRIGGGRAPEPLLSWYGQTTGRWEGDTLVTETTHFRKNDTIRIASGFTPLVVRQTSTIVERFTLIAPDELLYQFTVLDPAVYARSWSAEYSMTRSREPMFETACHEGNYALANILKGARMAEARAAKAATNR
jgi:hypothetical protein